MSEPERPSPTPSSSPAPAPAPISDAEAMLAGGDRPHRPTDDREELYYEGSPMLRGEIGTLTLWTLGGLVLIVLAGFAVAHGWWSFWLSVLLIVLGIIAVIIPIVIVRSIHYRISNYRIDYERGILSKRIDTLELWHVDDVSLYQNLLDRILGVGTITVVSNDDTTPRLLLRSIPNPRPLFENLKQRIIAVKRQRGVIKMDLG